MKFDTVRGVQIHLRDKARKAAASALYGLGRIGWWASYNYKGPYFVEGPGSAVAVAVGQSTVNVRTQDATGVSEYIYPLDTVARVKVSH